MERFDSPQNSNWHLYLDYDMHNIPNLNLLFNTFEIIYPLVKIYLPFDLERNLSIVNPTQTGPVYFYQSELIFLDVKNGTRNLQFVFQFGHEICHFAIKSTDCSNTFAWFEEVIADLSSIYLIYLYFNTLVGDEKINAINYYTGLFDSSEYEPILLNRQTSIQTTERKKQRFISLQLLHIFMENPSFWKEIVYISNIHATTLSDFFHQWRSLISQSSVPVLTQIAAVFSVVLE